MRAVIAEMPASIGCRTKRRPKLLNGTKCGTENCTCPRCRTGCISYVERDLMTYFVQMVGASERNCRDHQWVNLTTPEDESHWWNNYRIPDFVIAHARPISTLTRTEYMVGAPLVCRSRSILRRRDPTKNSISTATSECRRSGSSTGIREKWIYSCS